MAIRRVDHPTAAGGPVANRETGTSERGVRISTTVPVQLGQAHAPDGDSTAPPSLVSIEQASKLAGVARRTIYYWIERGLVRTVRVASGRIRIERDSLFRAVA